MATAKSVKRPTRKDVARIAGTSTAVVSYVINDGPRPVAPATRQRVLDAIEQVGYMPDSIARALSSGESGAFGLIVPDISNPFFGELAQALEEAAAAQGKLLLLGNSAESKQRESELIASLTARRIDGLFFVGVDGTPMLAPAYAAGIPVILLDRMGLVNGASSVLIDNRGAARAITAHLISHGVKKIGIITGPAGLAPSEERLAGWQEAMTTAGLPITDSWMIEAPFSRRGGYEATLQMLAHAERPQALFASNEQQAVGALAAAAQLSLSVPNELALVSFDGTEAGVYTVPALTGIVQPLADIARAAVSAVNLPVYNDGTRGVLHQMCDFELRIGGSCGSH